jgi:hypothetical protein
MQVTAIDHMTFAETITSDRFEILQIVEAPGASHTYIAMLDGAEVLIVTDAYTGAAIVIHDHHHDDESGGSIHSHARAINAAA